MIQYKTIGKWMSAALMATFTLTSCSEGTMDKINEDVNHPYEVPAKFIVSDVTLGTAVSGVGGDFNLYSMVYMEHEAGTSNQMWRAEHRSGEPTASSTYNNAWLNIYSNIKNAKIAIDQCVNNSEDQNNVVTEAIARIMLAYNGALATDMFGDTPYSETGVLNADGTPAYMQPKIDSQESIYKDVMAQLDKAIELLNDGKGRDTGFSGAIGSKDYIYGGNAEKWLKAAYALKARYTMHLLNRSSDKTADLNNVLTYVSKAFTSADNELKLAVYDGDAQCNPFFVYNYSRKYSLSTSASLVAKFKERNDPRGLQAFLSKVSEEPVKSFDAIVAAPNGESEESESAYDFSFVDFALTTPTQLMSYHELLFIKAEAEARLNKPEAKETLKAAIAAAFANLQATLSDADGNWFQLEQVFSLTNEATLDSYWTSIESLYNANHIKEIMAQKYLAFFGASSESVEAYNDYRRLKAENAGYAVTLANPLNASRFPLRLGYGGSDVSANQAVKAAFGNGSYVYTENVWWAGGTR